MKKVFYHGMRSNKKMIWLIGGLLALLFLLTLSQFFYQKKVFNTRLVQDHVKQLVGIFNKIHTTCHIIDFDHQKNQIDFLNVISFAGSEVGSMNLKYPERWQGPYLKENLTMQEKPYLIVKTKQGLFITPGEGVKLANNKVVGKDILLTYETDLEALMYDKQAFLVNNQPLIAPLYLHNSSKKNEKLAELVEEDGY